MVYSHGMLLFIHPIALKSNTGLLRFSILNIVHVLYIYTIPVVSVILSDHLFYIANKLSTRMKSLGSSIQYRYGPNRDLIPICFRSDLVYYIAASAFRTILIVTLISSNHFLWYDNQYSSGMNYLDSSIQCPKSGPGLLRFSSLI